MPPINKAAWHSANAKPFQIGPAPYTPPGPGQVVIKNGAVAINSFDSVLQAMSTQFVPYLKYPTVLGTDVAGTVVEVGPDVKRFRVGDRVYGNAACIAKQSNDPAEGGFQLYCVLREHMIAPTPDHITDEQASAIGLGFVTASVGLFDKKHLGLDLPTVPASQNMTKKDKARVLIITGGASSVGSNAIQLAVAAGYQVLSTSSPKNFDLVKRLGASHVFDYKSKTLVQDMLDALQDRYLAGALTIGEGSTEVCIAIMRRHDPSLTNKFIAMAGRGVMQDGSRLNSLFGRAVMMLTTMTWFLKMAVLSYFSKVQTKFIYAWDVVELEGVVARLYADFLPEALATRQFVPSPDPLVVGKGLESVQEAMDFLTKGVSAKKVVVSLNC